MDDRFAAALRLLPDYLAQHVILSLAALLLGVAISLPLALLAARRQRWRWPVLTGAGLVQTIPGLALLALFYPVLLGLSSVTEGLVGVLVAGGTAASLHPNAASATRNGPIRLDLNLRCSNLEVS